MADLRAILVPDIGDFENIPVIEVLVKPGDTVKAKDSLITLECDKATMEIPVPFAGVVKELKINLGDKVSEGSAILTLDVAEITPFAISFGATLAKAARLVSTFVARPSFAKGLEACEQQDYVTALRILRRLAKKGDACSQLKIGEIYGSGLGVPKDREQELEWYRKAGEQGEVRAQFRLGAYRLTTVNADNPQTRIMQRRRSGIGRPPTKEIPVRNLILDGCMTRGAGCLGARRRH